MFNSYNNYFNMNDYQNIISINKNNNQNNKHNISKNNNIIDRKVLCKDIINICFVYSNGKKITLHVEITTTFDELLYKYFGSKRDHYMFFYNGARIQSEFTFKDLMFNDICPSILVIDVSCVMGG